jgi:hypothetical protein
MIGFLLRMKDVEVTIELCRLILVQRRTVALHIQRSIDFVNTNDETVK